MTEEEYFRKTYPDFCYSSGKPLSPYWDLFQDGVEFGERQSEEKIEDLEETINKLREQFALRYDLEDKLEKENAQAKEIIKNLLILKNDHFGNTKMEWRVEVTEQAEQFLKENE